MLNEKIKLAVMFLAASAIAGTSNSWANPDDASIRQGPRPIKPGEHGIGRQLPDLTLIDLNDNQRKLSELSNHKAIVLAMTGTGCPLCLKYSPTLAAIEKQYQSKNVRFIFINPNESESDATLTDAIKQNGLQGIYVSDGDKTLTASLGAKTTTEVFVIDRARTLVYRGAVDDQYGFGYSLDSPRVNYLTDALDAVLTDETPSVQATTSPGCELFYDPSFKNKRLTSEHGITYHNRISRIIQANCIECHRDGGIAPIALENFAEVKDYAGMIRNVVDRGIMPPWFAAPQPSSENDDEPSSLHWANDRSLSDDEKRDLFAWIKAGAPKGDPADAPVPKTFPGGWLIGKPDAVFEFPRPVPVKATGIMPYKNITVETGLKEDKWVQAIEIRPGQRDVVHHVIVSIRSDQQSFDERDGYWGAYVPGNSTLIYPDGFARLLLKGAKLRFQMHYTPNGTATEDSTRIGLVFSKKPPKHQVKVVGIANGKIKIPPHAENHEETASIRAPRDAQILSFLPHMHLRGKAARYELLTSDGKETLLDIPRYDFNWQLIYRLAEPKMIRAGDTIRFTGWFDNSASNPANPDPNKTVRWGQQTHDEMHLGYVEYIIPGATPGEHVPSMRQSIRERLGRNERSASSPDEDEIEFGGQRIVIAVILNAIRELDRNNDGKLERSEVPAKRHRMFDLLDSDDDNVLTVSEARETIRKYQRARR